MCVCVGPCSGIAKVGTGLYSDRSVDLLLRLSVLFLVGAGGCEDVTIFLRFVGTSAIFIVYLIAGEGGKVAMQLMLLMDLITSDLSEFKSLFIRYCRNFFSFHCQQLVTFILKINR